jgi:serine/threonine protein kinase
MKIMCKKFLSQYSSTENLKREIKIQRNLNHPHIVKLFHSFEDKENVYLVMEYAKNGRLSA